MSFIYKWLAIIGGAIAAVFGAYLAGGRVGKVKNERDQARITSKISKEARETDKDVRDLPDADIDNELRRHRKKRRR